MDTRTILKVYQLNTKCWLTSACFLLKIKCVEWCYAKLQQSVCRIIWNFTGKVIIWSFLFYLLFFFQIHFFCNFFSHIFKPILLPFFLLLEESSFQLLSCHSTTVFLPFYSSNHLEYMANTRAVHQCLTGKEIYIT